MSSRAIPPAPVEPPENGDITPFGLFSVADMQETQPRHELNGIEYEPVCSSEVHEWPLECADYRDTDNQHEYEPLPPGKDDGPQHPYGRKLFGHTTGVTNANPFAVYAGETCFLGNHASQRAVSDLRERFRLGEQRAVERVIYHGLMGVTPAIRYNPRIVHTDGVGDGLLAPGDGVALLEQWLAETYGSHGVIHAPLWMAPPLGYLPDPDGRMLTPMGNHAVFGAGYTGDPPFNDEQVADEAPDKTWLYATRPVTVRRSSMIQPAEYADGAFSKRHNTASLLVERVYVVDWPCEVAAVQVDFPRWRLGTRAVHDPAPPPPPPDGEDEDEDEQQDTEQGR